MTLYVNKYYMELNTININYNKYNIIKFTNNIGHLAIIIVVPDTYYVVMKQAKSKI